MQFADPILQERTKGEIPTEPQLAFFWWIDKINLQRSCGWTRNYIESNVRKLSTIAETLYSQWLNKKGLDGSCATYLYMVLPFISFRFFNSPGLKEVVLSKVTDRSVARLIEAMVDQDKEDKQPEFQEAILRQSAKRFKEFLREIEETRFQ